MACVHDPRSGQQRYVDANRVVERRPSKTDRGTIWPGDSYGGFAHKQDGIVVTLDQAAFGGEIEYVGGVGTLTRRKMVAQRGQRVFRTVELDMSSGCVAERVFTLCMFPVMVAVVQQSVGKMGRCSLDVRIRGCRVQGRRKWQRDRPKVGRRRRRSSRGAAIRNFSVA